MAMNADEALAMTDRAREAGVLALIDHELRCLKSRRTMRAMLHSGESDCPPLPIIVSFGLSNPCRPALDWWSDQTWWRHTGRDWLACDDFVSLDAWCGDQEVLPMLSSHIAGGLIKLPARWSGYLR